MPDRRAASAAIWLPLFFGSARAALAATPIGYFDVIDDHGSLSVGLSIPTHPITRSRSNSTSMVPLAPPPQFPGLMPKPLAPM
jgi:hypothetical protein